MKKRKIAISVAAVLLLAIIIAIMIINVNEGKVKLFTDSNYPCAYRQENNSVVFWLKDKQHADLAWQVEEEVGIADAEVTGEGKGRKVSFTLSAKAPGRTEIRLYKKMELSGFEVEIVSVNIPVYISESETGLVFQVFGTPTLADYGGSVGGKDTDNPYILLNESDGTARVVFVKGQSDWIVSDNSNMAKLEWAAAEGNVDVCQVSENPDYDPDAPVTEAIEETSEDAEAGDGSDNAESDGAGKDAGSGGANTAGSGEKPAKTAGDIADMVISDEDYRNGTFDLSAYLVDGEIPEDVLKALDRKLDEKAKELGEYVPEEETESSSVSVAGTEAAVREEADGSEAAADGEAATDGETAEDGEAAAADETAAGGEETTASAAAEGDGTDPGAALDYSGLYETYEDTAGSALDASDTETGSKNVPVGIDPETGMLILDEKEMEEEKVTVVKETILTVSSEQYHAVEYIRVAFMSDGTVLLSISKKGPRK